VTFRDGPAAVTPPLPTPAGEPPLQQPLFREPEWEGAVTEGKSEDLPIDSSVWDEMENPQTVIGLGIFLSVRNPLLPIGTCVRYAHRHPAVVSQVQRITTALLRSQSRLGFGIITEGPMTKTDTLNDIIGSIEPISAEWIDKATARTASLVMPPRALGRLHDIAERLCGIGRTLSPAVQKRAFLVMAGDHGIADEGVSAFPQEVTGEMIRTFLVGGAGINVLARQAGADVRVVDMGVIPDLDPETMEGGDRLQVVKIRKGTENFSRGPAMTLEDAQAAVIAGYTTAVRLLEDGVDIIGTGDMGIANTTPSAAIGAVITGAGLDEMVGPGTGIDDTALQHKKEVVQRGIEMNGPDREDGLDVLSKVGGFEIGGIAGIVLAAAHHRKPVVIDGFISTAGALIAHALCPAAAGYMFAGHCSEEPGHRAMLNYLGLRPILDLGLRLGEGTGGAMAMMIIDSAVRIFSEMLTFEEAGVTGG